MRTVKWDGKDLSVIQMLDAKRVNGVPAVTVDQGTWDLRVRGYEGVVPVGSVIDSYGGTLRVRPPHRPHMQSRAQDCNWHNPDENT